MAPPTDHLIRDYLNRLSIAARGQLGPDDRRALVDRTREFIERQSEASGPLTALEVGRLLWGLGDPSALVEQERQRVAADGGELPEQPATRNPIAKVLRRDSGKVRGASWHWPVVSGGQPDSRPGLPYSHGAADRGRGGSNGAVSDASANGRGRNDSREAVPYVPAQPGDGDWFFRALGGHSAPEVAEPQATHEANSPAADVEDGVAEPREPAPTIVSPAWQLTTPRAPVIRRQARAALTVAAAWYRRRPLEASAVVVLGLGATIYPPVWLLGVVVALPSRVWDGRDKWLGLAAPVLLTIMAAALGVTLGGHVSLSHGLHEGWTFGVAGSRVAAVLGAGYLCWRSMHERRPPAVPPWNRPHKVG